MFIDELGNIIIKILNLKLVIMLEYQNIETFSKGYKEVFEERLTKKSYKKQINKITIEKLTNRKDNKLYVK